MDIQLCPLVESVATLHPVALVNLMERVFYFVVRILEFRGGEFFWAVHALGSVRLKSDFVSGRQASPTDALSVLFRVCDIVEGEADPSTWRRSRAAVRRALFGR